MRHDAVTLRRAVERYLGALERFDLAAALACFTEDAFYSHPPYGDGDNGGRRHEVCGHDALLALFERRGHRSDVHHAVTHAAIEGDHGFVAGTFLHGNGLVTGSFISAVTLDADGRIAGYAAYASIPGVGGTVVTTTGGACGKGHEQSPSGLR